LSSGERGRRLELLESISDLYLDASEDTTGDRINPDNILPIVDCDSDSKYLRSLSSVERSRLRNEGIRRCVDLSNAVISGGTRDGDTEHIIIVQWQHCNKFRPSRFCASKSEFERELADVKLELEVFNKYAKFANVETEVLGTARVPTLILDTAQDQFKNVKGWVSLQENQATFMDNWASFYPDFDTVEEDYLSVLDFQQVQSNSAANNEPNFGFTFALKQSS